MTSTLSSARSASKPHNNGAEPEAIDGGVATEGKAATGTVCPQPIGILSGHFAFLFKADFAHIEAEPVL